MIGSLTATISDVLAFGEYLKSCCTMKVWRIVTFDLEACPQESLYGKFARSCAISARVGEDRSALA